MTKVISHLSLKNIKSRISLDGSNELAFLKIDD